ncbi:hypothetical protein CRG98_024862, partial [Punica granatum]
MELCSPSSSGAMALTWARSISPNSLHISHPPFSMACETRRLRVCCAADQSQK